MGAGALSRRHGSGESEAPAHEQVTLEFKRNALLPALAGNHGRNLVRLEQKLGVRLAQRGNLIAVEGVPEACEHAAQILRALYERLEAGEELTMGDVDAEIGFASARGHELPQREKAGTLRTTAGKITRARSNAQSAYIELMRNHELVFGLGPAGTGKTYLAAAFGAHLLHERRVERLILSRPALEAGERLGFLPGDLKEKIDPYLRPLYDALFDVLGERCTKLMETGIIEVAPLAFMRGRTLSRAFVILDEAQNCTPAQMKMFLTRLGDESRMVVTGDPSQSDLPVGPQGLSQAVAYLEGVEGVGMAWFSAADIVRHPLVNRIVAAYDSHEPGVKSRSRQVKRDTE
ncbi:MAG TPA: PhoH family protein [Micropepsaceae bacterium]|nr:PhoH family protein [Micropepsaceae bacterium]